MANIEQIIPFLIFFETGVSDTSQSNEWLFEKARDRGIVNDPDDTGGATLVGVTSATYLGYRRKMGLAAMPLKNITYPEWHNILKTTFWDRWQADKILDQKVAEMLVDWVWTSGTYGIKLPQRILKVTADGIVGTQTLNAVNSSNPQKLFMQLKNERLAYTERICKSRPKNMKFRSGWIRRINAVGSF